jgi:hypothetical protein
MIHEYFESLEKHGEIERTISSTFDNYIKSRVSTEILAQYRTIAEQAKATMGKEAKEVMTKTIKDKLEI